MDSCSGRPGGGIETDLNDRWLQPLAEGASFQTETHKLRKTWATRLALDSVPPPMLQKLLGHKSLAYTQRYLYITKPKLVAKLG